MFQISVGLPVGRQLGASVYDLGSGKWQDIPTVEGVRLTIGLVESVRLIFRSTPSRGFVGRISVRLWNSARLRLNQIIQFFGWPIAGSVRGRMCGSVRRWIGWSRNLEWTCPLGQSRSFAGGVTIRHRKLIHWGILLRWIVLPWNRLTARTREAEKNRNNN